MCLSLHFIWEMYTPPPTKKARGGGFFLCWIPPPPPPPPPCVLRPLWYTVVGSDVMKQRNCLKDVDLKGVSLVSLKRGGCKFGHRKSKGCPLPKTGGCSFAVRAYPPPPPPRAPSPRHHPPNPKPHSPLFQSNNRTLWHPASSSQPTGELFPFPPSSKFFWCLSPLICPCPAAPGRVPLPLHTHPSPW